MEKKIKKLVKTGNSYAVVLDKPIREMYGIGKSVQLDFRKDGLVIEPAND